MSAASPPPNCDPRSGGFRLLWTGLALLAGSVGLGAALIAVLTLVPNIGVRTYALVVGLFLLKAAYGMFVASKGVGMIVWRSERAGTAVGYAVTIGVPVALVLAFVAMAASQT